MVCILWTRVGPEVANKSRISIIFSCSVSLTQRVKASSKTTLVFWVLTPGFKTVDVKYMSQNEIIQSILISNFNIWSFSLGNTIKNTLVKDWKERKKDGKKNKQIYKWKKSKQNCGSHEVCKTKSGNLIQGRITKPGRCTALKQHSTIVGENSSRDSVLCCTNEQRTWKSWLSFSSLIHMLTLEWVSLAPTNETQNVWLGNETFNFKVKPKS